jgi:malonyl-CoA O-methyltransferase
MLKNTLSRRRLRRAFDRAAREFDSAASLHREIADRMIERLSVIRLSAGTILDAGCGTGYASKLLRLRFAHAVVIELDHSAIMLRQRANRRRSYWPWPGWRRSLVCADFQRVPLGSSSVDLIWSNLALHWAQDIPAVLAEAHRVLRPGGLLMFSMFGPDTLKELNCADADYGFRVNPFIDMHDIGDVLVHTGYADPVMDMEFLTLTYANVPALLHDLKAQGSSCIPEPARKGLTARSAYESVIGGYEKYRSDDGRLPATFEIVYGHAWKPASRVTPAGKPIINIRAT